MNTLYDEDFFGLLDSIILSGNVIIDRPKGSAHPRYPEIVYELDYGYIQNSSSMDGDGIDVWVGCLPEKNVTGIICTVDKIKRDSEIKILLGCSEEDMEVVYKFHNKSENMKGILIVR